ncbi:MAG: AAA family ATPase [Myxococcales bacterium]|nr:AAA family ATPase [Myxococcales bacterium]
MVVPLRELHIQNFRGVREATIRLDPRVTVLFGANAAGKSTILDALAIGLGAITARVPKAKGRDFAKRGDLRVTWIRSHDVVQPDVRVEWGTEMPFARIALVSEDDIRWDVTRLRSQQDRGTVPKGHGVKALHEWLDPRVREVLDGGRPVDPLPLVAAYGNERAVVQVPLREKAFNTEFDRFGALDEALQATTRFKRVFEWFRVMEDEERRGMEQRRDFDYRLPALEWIRRAVGAAGLRCRDPRVETKPIRMLVDFELDDRRLQPLDISALSDGYRTHFALVVDLARRMVQLNPSDDLDDPERGTNSPAVVLIDEVDLHLDPTWQARVVQGLLAAFPRTQFVLTTHSEQVIGSVQAQHVRHLRWSEDEIVVDEVPFAQGATGERILVDLMGASQRVPGPVTERLAEYRRLVGEGRGASPEAVELRRTLEHELPGDPALHGADLEMQRQQLMARFRGGEG